MISAQAVGVTAQRFSGTAIFIFKHSNRRISPILMHFLLHYLRHWGDVVEATDLLASWRAAMSPFHFLREFRNEVGVTPHQYLLGRRLRRAAIRLREGDEPVLSVALNSGFNDISEFNRRFKRLMGLSPTQFRTHHHPPLADGEPFKL